MKQIKYSYCLNEKNELVHISTVTKDNRHSHTYHCLECGQKLIPKALCSEKVTPHFAHIIDTACDGESYLHKLAKYRIREKFLSTDSFPITFVRDVICQNANNACPCYQEGICIESGIKILRDLKTWNGKVVNDICQEEIQVGEFRPDLVLRGPLTTKLGPVFIEIYKTHESSEEKKSSYYKIIETYKLKNESDIDDIIHRGFIEGENCQTYNFSPKLPSIRKKDIPIERFVLFKNGAAIVYKSIDYVVTCDELNKRHAPNSVKELNMKDNGIDLWGNFAEKKQLDSYQIGLVYLIKKGLTIKNCILCKFRKYNDVYCRYICIRYKSLGADHMFPKQSMANTCNLYELDQELINHPLSELETVVSEVPI